MASATTTTSAHMPADPNFAMFVCASERVPMKMNTHLEHHERSAGGGAGSWTLNCIIPIVVCVCVDSVVEMRFTLGYRRRVPASSTIPPNEITSYF